MSKEGREGKGRRRRKIKEKGRKQIEEAQPSTPS
jgi:hypothetical protein